MGTESSKHLQLTRPKTLIWSIIKTTHMFTPVKDIDNEDIDAYVTILYWGIGIQIKRKASIFTRFCGIFTRLGTGCKDYKCCVNLGTFPTKSYCFVDTSGNRSSVEAGVIVIGLMLFRKLFPPSKLHIPLIKPEYRVSICLYRWRHRAMIEVGNWNKSCILIVLWVVYAWADQVGMEGPMH